MVAIYSTFLQRAYDPIIHDVSLQKLPVVLALDRAGLVGDDGPTHHGVFDLSYLRHIPGLTVMAPSSAEELRRMLSTALALGTPAAIRYPRGAAPQGDTGVHLEPLVVGKSRVLREGDDCALLAVGTMVPVAQEAAERLAANGIECTVVDVRFVKPLDEQLISRLANETGHLITIEENCLAGGYGAAVAEYLADQGLKNCTLTRLGLPDEFVEHGEQEALLAQWGLDSEGIKQAVERVREPGNSLAS